VKILLFFADFKIFLSMLGHFVTIETQALSPNSYGSRKWC